MTKRKDGRWCANITIAKGKRKTIYAATEKELIQKIADIQNDLGKGLDLTADCTFGYWCDAFLRRYEKRSTEAWYTTEKTRLQAFRDVLDSLPLKTIKPFQIEEILEDLAEYNPYTHKPTSQKTLKEYKTICGKVFDYAIENRVTEYNPCKYVQYNSKQNKKIRRALSSTEISAIEKMDNNAGRIGTFAIYSGLRQGELTALTWDDIDIEKRLIRVNKSFDNNTQAVKLPKTEAGIRYVPINDKLLHLIQKTPKSKRKGLVFTEDGQRLTKGWYRGYVKQMLIAVDRELYPDAKRKDYKVFGTYTIQIYIEPFDFHSLRHTFATLLYDNEIDVLTAQRWLGHADPQTTMNIYTHLSNDRQKTMTEKWCTV